MFNPDGTLKNNAGVLANIEYSVLPKAKENGIYTVLSLGGGGSEPSSAFASVTKNAEARKTLINNVIDLINKYGFDGVDVDWETPTSSQAQYFTLFIKELNEAVKKNNSHHLVTAAIGGGKWQPTRYDLSNSSKYLDFINVKIKNIARDPGNRAKVAVYTERPNIDPLGACVGNHGTRINTIVSELNGEKIDLVLYCEDPLEYIARALSPAKVISVETNESLNASRVIVPDDKLSLAIGKGGQNVRLAARLTGWKIEVKPESSVGGVKQTETEDVEYELTELGDEDSFQNFDDLEEVSGDEFTLEEVQDENQD